MKPAKLHATKIVQLKLHVTKTYFINVKHPRLPAAQDFSPLGVTVSISTFENNTETQQKRIKQESSAHNYL